MLFIRHSIGAERRGAHQVEANINEAALSPTGLDANIQTSLFVSTRGVVTVTINSPLDGTAGVVDVGT
jgi:hypothetical protein